MLATAATACPDGWTPGPATSCYMMTSSSPSALATHEECATLCGANASLACITSTDEHDFVMREFFADGAAASSAWHGLYQWPTDQGPNRGWDRCSTGEHVGNFSSWGQRDDQRGIEEACAVLYKDGTWKDKRCINYYPCLCERSQTASTALREGSTTSPAYESFAEYIRTPRYTAAAYHQARVVAVLVAVIMLIPPLLVWIGAFGGRCTPGSRLLGITQWQTCESASVRDLALERAAQDLAARRLKASFGSFYLGFILLCLSAAPYIAERFVNIPEYPSNLMMNLCAPPSIVLLLVAIMPTDDTVISMCCIIVFVSAFGLFGALAKQVHEEVTNVNVRYDSVARYSFSAATSLLVGMMLLTSLRVGDPGFPGRTKLRRLWMAARIGLGLNGANFILYSVWVLHVTGGLRDSERQDPAGVRRIMIGGCNFLLCGILPTFTVRGQMSRLLGRIGSTTSELQQAASIGALLDGASSILTILTRARENFRVMSLDQLLESQAFHRILKHHSITRAHKLSPETTDAGETAAGTDPGEIPILEAVHLPLGECDAFISHSWHDAIEEAKSDALQRWAAEHQAKDLFVWFDGMCLGDDLDTDLPCLPIWLSGCKNLLVLAGETYTRRLWCLLEVFVFVRMGGDPNHVRVMRLDNVEFSLSCVDVGKAQCSVLRDREKLLAVIETGFGSLKAFDRAMASVLDTAQQEHQSSIMILMGEDACMTSSAASADCDLMP